MIQKKFIQNLEKPEDSAANLGRKSVKKSVMLPMVKESPAATLKRKSNRVLFILTNSFTNDSRVLKEGRSLVNAGYGVTLACLFKEGLPIKEVVHGIKVNRLRFYHNSKKTANSVISKFISFFYYARFSYRICSRFCASTDIVHCHDIDTLPIGVILKIWSFGRIKIIYDAHEYETEVGFSVVGFKKLVYKIVETICIKFAGAVITVSDGIAKEYVRLYKITKPTVLFNTPLLKEPQKLDIFRKELGIKKDKQIFLYQGGFMENRGIEIIIAAFKKLVNTNKVVVFMGYGELEVYIKDAAMKFANIYFYPAVSPDVLPDYTASADIGIALIENSCLSYYYCLPNKLFEYTMAKIPTIVSDLFELRKFIETNKNGIVLEQITEEHLVKLIQNIGAEDLQRMKVAADVARQKYHWAIQEEKLLQLYKTT